jgi:cellulose synthase/poly-beta-1,6-N-acetylglucosamine synthase-like glycosyltransferase/CheY-like chemotaxis protein
MVEEITLDPPAVAGASAVKGVVLVLEEDRPTLDLIVSVLGRNDYDVLTAQSVSEALRQLAATPPDLVISDLTLADRDGVDFLQGLRANPSTNAIPILFLTTFGQTEIATRHAVSGDDAYLGKPVRPPELVARVSAMLAPALHATSDPQSRQLGLPLPEHIFESDCRVALERIERQRLPASLAYLELFELSGIRDAVGTRAETSIALEIAQIVERVDSVAKFGVDASGRFMLLIGAAGAETRIVLNALSRAIVAHRFALGPETVRRTPIVSFATRTGAGSYQEMRRRAAVALVAAASDLDLQAVRYGARLEKASAETGSPLVRTRARVQAALKPLVSPFQVTATLALALVVPFLAYWFLAAHGADVTGGVYLVCVAMLLLTALGIWCESFLALKNEDPPSAGVYPAASAIIAAYLPNETATALETIEAFLNLDYAADLQVIFAYNTPRPLPMEEELQAIARRDPRFVPLRVSGSTSKAQNVNAALRIVRGAFVGIFDADHKPDPNSYTRAWDWLASGYDVVQGHCVIRNGDASPIAQLVAVEFESIYAVSHPGRTRLHGFGLFGGSNGYWKTDLLRQTRMQTAMLTEDIDSSLRVITAGYRIASDPKLISRELAPLTLRAFWHQRLRWAQGWFQVSLKHVVPALKSPYLSARQKAGVLHLLLWRECYVWICVQILPILAFWVFVRHEHVSWFVPLFLVTTIVTTLTGPLQLFFTYLRADAEVRKRGRWFLTYLIYSLVFFSELKNVISRLAHFKETLRERAWKVTPRSTSAVPPVAS